MPGQEATLQDIILDWLRIDEHKADLNENNFSKLFTDFHNQHNCKTSNLTKLLLDAGIAPTVGINSVSLGMFAHLYYPEIELQFADSRYIGQYEFYISNFKRVYFSEGVVELGAHCFEDAIIQEINLPKSLKIVGPAVFARTSVKRLTYAGSKDDWEQNVKCFDTRINSKELQIEYLGG